MASSRCVEPLEPPGAAGRGQRIAGPDDHAEVVARALVGLDGPFAREVAQAVGFGAEGGELGLDLVGLLLDLGDAAEGREVVAGERVGLGPEVGDRGVGRGDGSARGLRVCRRLGQDRPERGRGDDRHEEFARTRVRNAAAARRDP